MRVPKMFRRGRVDINRRTVVGLTESGKKKAEKEMSQGPTFAILSTLDECPNSTIGQVSEETGIEIEEVKERVRILANQGFVRLRMGDD